QPLVQAVGLTFSGQAKRRFPARQEHVRIELGEPLRDLLPPLGLGMASHGAPLTERELELVETLGVDHLRADLDLSGAWRDELEQAADLALSLGAALELALLLGPEGEAGLAALAHALPLAQAAVARLLVLEPGQAVTGSSAVRLARDRLAAAAPAAVFACGTGQWFTELNRDPPNGEGAHAGGFSLCATVHAGRDISGRETAASPGGHGGHA